MKKTVFLLFITIFLLSCSKEITSIAVVPPEDDIVMILEDVKPAPVEEPEPVKPVRAVQTIVIYFDLDSYAISESEKAKLWRVDKPASLTGGCCPIGTDSYNYTLGFSRTYAVRDALERKGIKVLTCTSVGERELVSEEDLKLNRRCEIRY